MMVAEMTYINELVPRLSVAAELSMAKRTPPMAAVVPDKMKAKMMVRSVLIPASQAVD